ncbi:hypothetical protein B566_EDAN011057 [Ephemera danica]|nr:hypothetical protein B566_EDAN011057 [Ephemera danica]
MNPKMEMDPTSSGTSMLASKIQMTSIMEKDPAMEMDFTSSDTSMKMEDEEKERSNMGNIPRYKRTPGTDASHGHKFEMDLCTLAYLRCMKLVRESEETKISGMKYFSLANNVQNIGAFDDIVVKVEYIEED